MGRLIEPEEENLVLLIGRRTPLRFFPARTLVPCHISRLSSALYLTREYTYNCADPMNLADRGCR